jgi:hypothetical protein
VIIFRTPLGKDQFEASCEWSESGKLVKKLAYSLEQPYSAAVLRQPHARTLMQCLSQAAGDAAPARVVFWDLWRPQADVFDTEAWFREVMEEETRVLGSDEAAARVEAAVAMAVADVRRLALPWFQRKLAVRGSL